MFHPTPVSVTNTNYQGTQHFANNIIFQHENAAFNEVVTIKLLNDFTYDYTLN